MPMHTCRAARQELQRLESSVARSLRATSNIVGDLRPLRSHPRATELRAEAAQALSGLKQQRSVLQKEIKRIVAYDV